MNPFRDCRVTAIQHAQQRSNERSITMHDVKRVLRMGQPKRLNKEKYSITHGALTVIAKLLRCNLVVITVYNRHYA